MNDEEKIKVIKNQFFPYKIELLKLYCRDGFGEYLYRVIITFDKNFVLEDCIFLGVILKYADILKTEFEKLNVSNYLIMINELEDRFTPLRIGNIINLSTVVNNFNLKDYKNFNACDPSLGKSNFQIRFNFVNNRITTIYRGEDPYPIEFIIFMLNDMKLKSNDSITDGQVFVNYNTVRKIKLLFYYSELFNFRNKLTDSIEKAILIK